MAMMITRTKQMSSVMIFRARQVMIAMGLVVTCIRWPRPNKYVIPDEDFHRRICKNGAIDFRTIDCGDWRPVVVVMAAILRPR
jgi:hypothetical protein